MLHSIKLLLHINTFSIYSSKNIVSLLSVYQDKVNKNLLKQDKYQIEAIKEFDLLNDKISNLKHDERFNFPFFNFSTLNNNVKGLYIFGSVGTGKTMLMDLFYEMCPQPKKLRLHFNEFMNIVHKKIYNYKKSLITKSRQIYDPIPPVAEIFVQNYKLLCLDEFQVYNIADAVILQRLFEEMWKNNLILVSTSNRAPSDLYKNGLQRCIFLPFIDDLMLNCQIIPLHSEKDYRLIKSQVESFVFCKSIEKFNKIFDSLCGHAKLDITKEKINIYGRNIVLNLTCGNSVYLEFEEICDKVIYTYFL
ncbi:Lactation elevated protein 1 [Intoshia linei]|uniref:Lactation elevated protein 1 n=1 Tax=Intoshia linei TaxID=1819745 RepID=A0A177B2K7_9BILA|nr:Lactation elevated protein 1 [Intoshia linei]